MYAGGVKFVADNSVKYIRKVISEALVKCGKYAWH